MSAVGVWLLIAVGAVIVILGAGRAGWSAHCLLILYAPGIAVLVPRDGGANAGYGRSDVTSPGTTGSIDASGFIGGGQIGANWQSGALVLGIEADFQGSGIEETRTIGIVSATASMPWFGTLRGRLGYPRPGDDVIGWSETLEGAERMAAAIRKAPGCSKAWVVDRAPANAASTQEQQT